MVGYATSRTAMSQPFVVQGMLLGPLATTGPMPFVLCVLNQCSRRRAPVALVSAGRVAISVCRLLVLVVPAGHWAADRRACRSHLEGKPK